MEFPSKEEKVELIELAIKQLMDEEVNRERNKKSSTSDESFVAVDDDNDDEDDHRLLLLTKLLSQLETLRAEGKLQLPESAKELHSPAVNKVQARSDDVDDVNDVDCGSSGIGGEEIVRELRKVKKQNFITHCLLSVMIVLTVAWQISEVSLILKVKDRVSNPFRSVGSMITGMLKGPNKNSKEGEKQSLKLIESSKLIESPSLPALKIPELPHTELPVFDLIGDDD